MTTQAEAQGVRFEVRKHYKHPELHVLWVSREDHEFGTSLRLTDAEAQALRSRLEGEDEEQLRQKFDQAYSHYYLDGHRTGRELVDRCVRIALGAADPKGEESSVVDELTEVLGIILASPLRGASMKGVTWIGPDLFKRAQAALDAADSPTPIAPSTPVVEALVDALREARTVLGTLGEHFDVYEKVIAALALARPPSGEKQDG